MKGEPDMSTRTDFPFPDDFIRGLEIESRRRYWYRRDWDASADDVMGILAQLSIKEWIRLDHPESSRKRIWKAILIAHGHRRQASAIISDCFRRKPIING
jgi:hypothetical protein